MTNFNPQNILSKSTSAVEEAAIIRMAQKARELKAQGRDVISLTLGEPDFDTPQHIQEAATKAIKDGFTHYSPMPGMPQLRQALADKLQRENNLNYQATDIVVSNGAKQALTNAIYATVDAGDEVILLAPYWVAYEGIIRMAGGVPIIVEAGIEDNFKAPAQRIKEAFSDRTKLLILNSPNNPTGAMFNRKELQDIADIVIEHNNMLVVSDEIYEYITFDEEHVSIGSLPDMKDRTITINGFSKGFAMTGWRLGYGAASPVIAKAMAKVQGTFTAGANAFVQIAAITALESPRNSVEEMRQSYLERRNLVIASLNNIQGITTPNPAGTFYAFPDISQFLGTTFKGTKINTADELCDWLLEKHLLATVPGSAFGDKNCLRISFATSPDILIKAIERLSKALNQLRA